MTPSLIFFLPRSRARVTFAATIRCLLLLHSGLVFVAESPQVAFPEKHRALLKEHCFSCHNAEKQKGKFRLDDLAFSITDNRSAERWQKVLNAVN